jgi:hypothetical protein
MHWCQRTSSLLVFREKVGLNMKYKKPIKGILLLM